MSLPPVLRVAQVMERYGMRDERTARRLMNEAGAFKVGGRLVVREDFLEQHERSLAIRENPASRTVGSGPSKRPAARPNKPSAASPASGPDWWRTPLGGAGAPADGAE